MLRLAVFAPAVLRDRWHPHHHHREEWGVGRPASFNQRTPADSEGSAEKSPLGTEEDPEEDGGLDGEGGADGDGRSEFQSAGGSMAPPDLQGQDDDDEYKIKHRYLPILSGLACPFSVLLDVSRDAST